MKILNYKWECTLALTATILSEQDITFWDLSSTLYSGLADQVLPSVAEFQSTVITNKPVSTVIAVVLVTLKYQANDPVI